VARPDYRSAEAAEYRKLYKSRAWRSGRLAFLRSHPICERCAKHGRITAATIVNHRQPHKGSAVLFFDTRNWQPLCKPCHDGPTQQFERRGYTTEVGADGFPIDPNHPANR